MEGGASVSTCPRLHRRTKEDLQIHHSGGSFLSRSGRGGGAGAFRAGHAALLSLADDPVCIQNSRDLRLAMKSCQSQLAG